MDLFREENQEYLIEGCKITLYPEFIDQSESISAFNQLLSDTPWKQEIITFMGKTHNVPRLTYWYSAHDKSYIYSGIKVNPVPYTPLVASLNERIERQTGFSFNSVLLNYYRDGNDCVSWHADDEKELGEEVNVASLSFGAERDFHLKSKDGKSKLTSISLTSGSLLVMEHPTQQKLIHQIPRRKRVSEPRINLTFRMIA